MGSMSSAALGLVRESVCLDHAIAYWPLIPSSHAPTTSSRSGGLGRVEEGEVVSDQTHSADQADPWKDHAQLTKPLPHGFNVWPVETSSPWDRRARKSKRNWMTFEALFILSQ